MPDFEELAAGLRANPVVTDAPRRAAVELLIWHEGWLRRVDFKNACVGTDQGVPYIRWDRAKRFADSGPRCSSSEMAVLRLAITIATDGLGLYGFGRAHRQAAVDAFAAALGVTSLTGEASRG